MYKAIFLDIDDTLFDFEQCSRGALQNTFQDFELAWDEDVYRAFRAIDDALWARQKQGQLTVEAVLQTRFEHLLRQLKLPPLGAAFAASFQQNLARQHTPEPHCAEVLKHLSGQYRLFAASNGTLRVQRKRLSAAGLLGYFSGVFVSDDIGYEKPDARFFTTCLQRSGVNVGDALMVGDSPEADIAGAAGIGMDTCWYNPGGKANNTAAKPTCEIASLTQLLSL